MPITYFILQSHIYGIIMHYLNINTYTRYHSPIQLIIFIGCPLMATSMKSLRIPLLINILNR